MRKIQIWKNTLRRGILTREIDTGTSGWLCFSMLCHLSLRQASKRLILATGAAAHSSPKNKIERCMSAIIFTVHTGSAYITEVTSQKVMKTNIIMFKPCNTTNKCLRLFGAPFWMHQLQMRQSMI